MNRRDFLRLAMGAAACGGSWRLWAAPPGSAVPRLLFVFLRGGYDALSAFVPYAEPFYYAARPNLALAGPKDETPDRVVALDDRWGLHPALADELLPFWERGQLGLVPFAGTDFVSRSHFQAQDWIEYGQPPGGPRHAQSGFLNRLLQQLGFDARHDAGVSFTDALPEIFRGPVDVPNAALSQRAAKRVTQGYEERLLGMYAGHELGEAARDGLGLRRAIGAQLQEEMVLAARGAPNASGFPLQAGRVGQLLRERDNIRLAFVDLGGWDTHAGQGGARGALAVRLRGLSEGLAAFAEALGPQWSNTVVVVLSEFGRTFRENGNRGTDHGHGSTLWVLGGRIAGGRIRGEQGGLRERDLHQGRDVPVLNEYRAILGGLFQRIYGLDQGQLEAVFPRVVARDLGLA